MFGGSFGGRKTQGFGGAPTVARPLSSIGQGGGSAGASGFIADTFPQWKQNQNASHPAETEGMRRIQEALSRIFPSWRAPGQTTGPRIVSRPYGESPGSLGSFLK